MVEGLIGTEEKPSNTEVLGLLMDEEKIKFISNLTHENIEGLVKVDYFTKRLQNPDIPATDILKEVIIDALAFKSSVPTKKGNRADQIVDALKHIIEQENKDLATSIADQIRS